MTNGPTATTAPAPTPAPLHSDSPDSHANACLGLYGITGVGKTSLIVTAIEEAWETYHVLTHYYSADLGGWGAKLLSLAKLGIVKIWYMRNHVNAFETMELASQGAWPETIQDPMTGLAAPDVRLILPRQTRWQLVCPNGHGILPTFAEQGQAMAASVVCPTCQQPTTANNALRVDKVIIRNKGFKDVGHRAYDSFTQLNEWGMTALKDKSAAGTLAANSPLVGADAFREGTVMFGTSTRAQFGFMQDRTPVWIANIRSIPEQVLPPILTFGVELSKGDDESGGMPIFGPKISGNARTSALGGWLGNMLYAAKEPHNPPEMDQHGGVQLYHRLWLTNHVDFRDARAIPIVAKHRGEPLGMPAFLEDPVDPSKAWTECSLRRFYQLLRDQQTVIEARDRAKYADAPGLQAPVEDTEEVIDVQNSLQASAGPSSIPNRSVVRRSRRPGTGATMTRAEAVDVVEASPATAAAPAAPETPAAPAATTPAAAGTVAALSQPLPAPAHDAAPGIAAAESSQAPVSRIRRRTAPVPVIASPTAAAPAQVPIADQLKASLAVAGQPAAEAAAAVPHVPATVPQGATGAVGTTGAPPVAAATPAAVPAPAAPPQQTVIEKAAEMLAASPQTAPAAASSEAPPAVAAPINRIRRVPRPPA